MRVDPILPPMNLAASTAPPRPKPLLRGVSHAVAALVTAPLVASLIAGAASPAARAAAATYGATVVALFTSSAVYHRPTWSPRVRSVLGRIDHAAIFLLIAGTYTPLCLLLGPGTGHGLLALVWSLATLGIALAVAWDDAPKPLRAALYVGLGWVFVPVLPALRAALGDGSLIVLLAGAALYTAGALVFVLRRPDPLPATFGFHEVFHLLVVAAAGCHFVLVARVVGALG
jgi:hemolysin III